MFSAFCLVAVTVEVVSSPCSGDSDASGCVNLLGFNCLLMSWQIVKVGVEFKIGLIVGLG